MACPCPKLCANCRCQAQYDDAQSSVGLSNEKISSIGEKLLKSESILKKIGQLEANQTEQAAKIAESTPLVIFQLDHAHFAFVGNRVKEILPYDPGIITEVPGFSAAIRGLINLRGDIEAVLNIHHALNLTDSAIDKHSRIILAVSNGIRCGVLVDSVEDVRDVDLNLIKPLVDTMPTAITECAMGGERLFGSHYVTVLDMDKLFHKIGIDRQETNG